MPARSPPTQVGARPPPSEQQLRERLEDAQWRRELLEQSRAEKTQELAESRGEAGAPGRPHPAACRPGPGAARAGPQIDEGKQLRDDDLAAARAELARLQDEIDQQASASWKRPQEAASRRSSGMH